VPLNIKLQVSKKLSQQQLAVWRKVDKQSRIFVRMKCIAIGLRLTNHRESCVHWYCNMHSGYARLKPRTVRPLVLESCQTCSHRRRS
jgi:hypothetical protein